MPKVNLIDTSGKKLGAINLPKEIFAAKINPLLMAQAVRVYLNNQRKAGAKTKARGEITRTKAKWYRQKGTGRARHGARSAPIFVGGGVAHGPTGLENFKLKISRKMTRAALFSALTSKLKDKEILVVKGLEEIRPKTKEMAKIAENLKLKTKNSKILIVLPEILENVIRAGRNIENLNLIPVNVLNTYEVLKARKIVFMKESVDKLKEEFLS